MQVAIVFLPRSALKGLVSMSSGRQTEDWICISSHWHSSVPEAQDQDNIVYMMQALQIAEN